MLVALDLFLFEVGIKKRDSGGLYNLFAQVLCFLIPSVSFFQSIILQYEKSCELDEL